MRNDLYFQDVLQAAKENKNADNFFNTSLAEKALQSLGDVGTVHFYDMKKQFTSGTHQFSGLTHNTMQELIKKAENYLRATEISTEQNYNQIDGIVNNEPPRTKNDLEQVAENRTSIRSKLKAFKELEKKPSKSDIPKNKDLER